MKTTKSLLGGKCNGLLSALISSAFFSFKCLIDVYYLHWKCIVNDSKSMAHISRSRECLNKKHIQQVLIIGTLPAIVYDIWLIYSAIIFSCIMFNAASNVF
jgi:hypothetical protein